MRLSSFALAAAIALMLSASAQAAAGPPFLSIGPIEFPLTINGQALTPSISGRLSLSTSTTQADVLGEATLSVKAAAASAVLLHIVQEQLPRTFPFDDCKVTVTEVDATTLSSKVGEADIAVSGHLEMPGCSKLFTGYSGAFELDAGLLPAPISSDNPSLKLTLVRPATIKLPIALGLGPKLSFDQAALAPVLDKAVLTIPTQPGIVAAFQGAAVSSDNNGNINLFVRADAHATGPGLRALLVNLVGLLPPTALKVELPK